MNAALLLEHYARIADAPDAIARLRRFVLDLAVRGKLVEQDASDEPASELLKRITAEKTKVSKGRSLAKEGASKTAQLNAAPFTIPANWTWCGATYPAEQVSDVGKKIQTKDVLSSGRHPVVDQGKVFIRGYCDDDEKLICVDIPVVIFGDHTRETKLVDFNFIVGADGVKILKPISILPAFYYLCLSWLPLGSRGYGRHFKLLREAEIPLPPLAEQHRIVAKVDELMALCDQLEAARASREAERDKLTAASLARLNAPDPETFPTDARFALNNLAPLTTRPDQIKQLRQTILNLAVRGKLVEQDAGDGSGLEYMAAMPIGVQVNGRSRRIIATSKIEPFEEYLDIPQHWTWARIHELGVTQTGTSPSSANPDLFGDFIPFIKPGDLDGATINYDGPGLSEAGVSQSRLAPAATVLMVCIGATLGKVNITDRNVCFNQQINSVTPYEPDMSPFLALALKASGFQHLAWSKAGTGTLPIISKGKWEILPIPVPPLAEQHRIVAKVDELMALCDHLEASLTTGEQTRSRLLDSVLHNALEPA